MTAALNIDLLRESLIGYGNNTLPTAEFVALWRCEAGAASTLPPRFGEVLDDLLMRVESSQLFTEESCSFSRSDLVKSLEVWLDKAAARLAG